MKQRAQLSLFGLTTIVAILGGSTHAGADATPTKEQCIAANESAQALRRTGKLTAARAQLVLCVQRACPGIVRDDCSERLSEVDKVQPSVAFAAKSPDGSDLSAVTVTMDGVVLAAHLDATALFIDPGEHTFELSAAGYASVTKKLIVREGEKGRVETVQFTPKPAAPVIPVTSAVPVPSAVPTASAATAARQEPAPEPVKPAQPVKDQAPRSEPNRSGRKTFAYVLGGLGIVGVGAGTAFGLVAKNTYDDAVKGCTDSAGATGCSPQATGHGKDAHTQALVSTISFIAGGALLAGGVVLYLTAPKDSGVHVQTTAGPGAAQLSVGGTW